MRKLPPEEAKARRYASTLKWRAANPEKIRKTNREGFHRWHLANPEKSREIARRWREANPENFARRAATRRAAQKQATVGDPKAVVAVYRRAKAKQLLPCCYCGKQTLPGDRHVDHIVPLAKGGPHSAENLCIACAGCNLSKGTKTAEEFMELRAA